MNRSGTLILVCGLPGSGKTRLAISLADERGALRMCPDDWIEAILENTHDTSERDRLRDPIENLQWELVKDYLMKGLTVVLENGFWTEEERTQYALEALEFNASIELHYLDAPNFDELWNRVEQRNHLLKRPTFLMTRNEVESAWNSFEAPSSEELAFYDAGVFYPWSTTTN